MTTKIIMYTGNTCGKCKAAKERLANLPPDIKENVELIERNVDKSEYDYKFLTETLKSNSLPTFLINPVKVQQNINH
ncbi:glutaredoxin family protein [Bacillus cereus]|uniref:glutaredoxin family protein n=1 Tax=Bacillus cereus TaxID=1396 RepID=UPI001E50F800|nr:glutaredoxin domain-containing protein [Bacillus cereus]MCU5047595.1 glutaredoxin family protein [Bacillus cereus]MCU5651906.1 glutaredoxin family protein [Bacillus cereus]